MRKRKSTAAVLSTVAMGLAGPAHATDVTLDYYLPEVKIGFGVSHTITNCPDAVGKGFAMDTVTAIKPVYGRGNEVKINPKGNLFVDRQVKLEYHENGTLKSFNGSSTGQGGKIVAAAIKAVSFVATTALGVPSLIPLDEAGNPSVDPIACKPKISELLKQKEGLKKELTGLKQALINQGSSENLLLQITRTEAALAGITSQLTVSPDPMIWTPTASVAALNSNLPPADLTVWFDSVPKDNLERAFADAGLGQVLAFKASTTFVTTVDPTSITNKDGTQKTYQALVYREPGAVKVTLAPQADFQPGSLSGVERALAEAAYEATKAKATVKVPQIGMLKVIPFNGSGIFGSRAVAAIFDQTGELTSIGYTSTGGADALAGVIDASVAAGVELRDQRVNAIKREIELRTQEKALEDLIEAEAKDEAEAVAGG
jgi:hypothetical protein